MSDQPPQPPIVQRAIRIMVWGERVTVSHPPGREPKIQTDRTREVHMVTARIDPGKPPRRDLVAAAIRAAIAETEAI